MNLYPETIKLNGESRSVKQLLNNSSSVPELVIPLVNFLKEWYSETDTIQVKTSGSTGIPKTIKLSKSFIGDSAARTIRYFNLKENDKVLHCLPLRYIAGKLMVVRALIGSLDLYMLDPSSDFEILNNEIFCFAAMVPNQVNKCLESDVNLDNLSQLLIGGSAIPLSLENRLLPIGTMCYSSYGMTETATHIAVRHINGPHADKIYHCLEGIMVKVNEDQCLQIFIPDYGNNPLQTNDIAEVFSLDSFRIKGRADNIIISGGTKYNPEELEAKLETHINFPFVISSRPHPRLGEEIILKAEAEDSEFHRNYLNKIFRENLEKYERPRVIEFNHVLERTENGKLKR